MDVEKALESVKEIEKKEKEEKATKMLVVVLIRGTVRVRHDIKKAIHILKLRKKHTCALLPNTPVNKGLLQKVKDYVAYGLVTQETVKMLQKRPSLLRDGKPLHVYRLAPPRGGYGKKGIKVSYQNGGCLGRRPDMGEFLKRMM